MSIAADDYWSPEAIRAREKEANDLTIAALCPKRAKAKRKPIAIVTGSDALDVKETINALVICDDGTVWRVFWDDSATPCAGWMWERIPDVPQDEGEPA